MVMERFNKAKLVRLMDRNNPDMNGREGNSVITEYSSSVDQGVCGGVGIAAQAGRRMAIVAWTFRIQ